MGRRRWSRLGGRLDATLTWRDTDLAKRASRQPSGQRSRTRTETTAATAPALAFAQGSSIGAGAPVFGRRLDALVVSSRLATAT